MSNVLRDTAVRADGDKAFDTIVPAQAARRWGRFAWALLIAVCVAGVSCTNPAGSGGGAPAGGARQERLRSLDEILASPVTVTDVTPDSATIRVQTTKPVMCSVVFGADERYGGQSTDPDMGGQPHADHHAPLRGLLADSVVHYRIQGTAPDGAMYVSGDLTFRTPKAAAAGSTRRNLASVQAGARVVEVSSVFGSSQAWKAENAIDGDPRTEWSSQGDGNKAFLTIELAEVTDIESVGAWTRTMGATAQISAFRVVGDAGAVVGPFQLPDASRLYTFPVQLRTRRLRFEVANSSGGNAGFVELGAFARE